MIAKASASGSEKLTAMAHGGPRYDLLTRVLHWIFAIGILYATAVGYALHFIDKGPWHDFLSRLNMSLATVLIVLFPIRLIWRLVRVNPVAPALPERQVRLSRGIQNLIYATITVVLVSGYMMVPDHYAFFGLVTIPTPFAKGPMTDLFFLAHRIGCAGLTGLVALHLAGVMLHTFVRPAGLLRRML